MGVTQMNFKNKYLVHTLRIVFALFLIFSGTGIFLGPDSPQIPEEMRAINQVFWDMGIFQLAKIMELAVGVLLLLNLFPALATVAFVPLSVGIVVFDANLGVQFLPVAIFTALLNGYLVYVYWKNIKPLFAKRIAVAKIAAKKK